MTDGSDESRTGGILDGKVAAIYGAGGSIGGAVARAFAREGAMVFLAGRTEATLDDVAEDIRSNGGEQRPPSSTHWTGGPSTSSSTRWSRRRDA